MDGDLGLNISVMGPDGIGLERTKAVMIVCRTETHPFMFQPLRPGEIFGREIALDGAGLEYKLGALGRYRVSAMLFTTQPKQWYKKWQGTASHDRDVQLDPERLFEGTLTSPPLEVEVVE
jgi:hypothetical protein